MIDFIFEGFWVGYGLFLVVMFWDSVVDLISILVLVFGLVSFVYLPLRIKFPLYIRSR